MQKSKLNVTPTSKCCQMTRGLGVEVKQNKIIGQKLIDKKTENSFQRDRIKQALHSIDGGYSCLSESSVSICHIIQYSGISPKKVGDHPWKMGDHPGEVGHPNGVESCQKSIGTIRCNLPISYNNWQFFWTQQNKTNKTK